MSLPFLEACGSAARVTTLTVAFALASCGGGEGERPASASGAGGEDRITGAGGAGGDSGSSLRTGVGAGDSTASSGATTGVTASDSSSVGAGGPHGPPYPVVLAHGFFGFDSFAGVDFVSYFFQVKEALAAKGEIVETPAVDPFNDSETRGEMLLKQVEAIAATTNSAKVNLVGHSQGGLDVRYVASKRPDLVASVVTVAAPHSGTAIADVALKVMQDDQYGELLDWFVEVLATPLYDEAGEETSLVASMKQLSTAGVAAFNAKYPNDPSVFYASIAARSDGYEHDEACEADVDVPFITKLEKYSDPLEPLMSLPALITSYKSFNETWPNDGLVRVKDAKWGEFWGCVPADHFDEIGQLFGDGPGAGNAFEHKSFYVNLVHHLRALGY